MSITQLATFLTLFALLGTSTVFADVNCNKPLLNKELGNCCRLPEPNFAAYQAQCPQLQAKMKRVPNPCAVECVFNASQVFQQDGKVNMDNARIMFNNVMNGTDFAQSFTQAFEKCDRLIQQRLASVRDGPRKAFGNCSPMPMVYLVCSVRNVFGDCPVSAWTSSEPCEQAKQYVNTCEPERGMGGGARMGGGPRPERMGNRGGGGGGAGGGGAGGPGRGGPGGGGPGGPGRDGPGRGGPGGPGRGGAGGGGAGDSGGASAFLGNILY